MAAEALVSSLLDKLSTAEISRAGRVLGVGSDLQKLESALFAIGPVIRGAEERSVTESAAQAWVARLTDAAYDADDLLDEFQTDAEWRNRNTAISKKVRVFFSRSNPLAFRIKMSSKIKAIAEKLDMIAKERIHFQLREDSRHKTRQRQTENRMTTSFIDETSIYGRDNDVDEILKLLFEKEADKEEEHLSVVAIVGLGGLGKMALAQLVYKRIAKQESFDLRAWVCVSDQFDIKRIAKAIIESTTKEACNLSELAPVVDHVREILQKKRFLLVLDDVWNENEDDGERLKNILAVGAKGSKIIVTTRSVKVASIMCTISPYHLEALSRDDCWRLFNERAFRGVQRDSSLEDIGREIVAKCGGSPLAAKALGSLMCFKTERGQWLAMRDDTSRDEGNQVMASLRLSYDHLSPELKQCFAYCCIFPKGTSIDREDLVLHWIALGFIASNTSLESSVNRARENFNNLVCISFLHEDSSRFYKMHVLVHDLAKSVAGDGHFIRYASQKVTIPRSCRFCTLVGALEESELNDLFRESQKIRAIRLQDSSINNFVLFTSLPRLRVLDMGDLPSKLSFKVPQTSWKTEHISIKTAQLSR